MTEILVVASDPRFDPPEGAEAEPPRLVRLKVDPELGAGFDACLRWKRHKDSQGSGGPPSHTTTSVYHYSL